MPTEEIRLDKRKIEELILCIVGRAPNIGVTKLEKLLYLCDFIHAENNGVPVTGETYRHFKRGPVPKHFVPIMEGMQNDIKTEEIPLKQKPGKFMKLTAKRNWRASIFKPEEKKTIDYVLSEFGHCSADELVAYVHNDITYKATKSNEDIPYSLAPYRRYERPSRTEAEELQRDPDYLKALATAFA